MTTIKLDYYIPKVVCGLTRGGEFVDDKIGFNPAQRWQWVRLIHKPKLQYNCGELQTGKMPVI